jgi:hypothetical protein
MQARALWEEFDRSAVVLPSRLGDRAKTSRKTARREGVTQVKLGVVAILLLFLLAWVATLAIGIPLLIAARRNAFIMDQTSKFNSSVGNLQYTMRILQQNVGSVGTWMR